MIAALDEFSRLFPTYRTPLYSTIEAGQRSPAALCDAGYWWQNVRAPRPLRAGHKRDDRSWLRGSSRDRSSHPVLASSIGECSCASGKTEERFYLRCYRQKPEQPSLLDSPQARYTWPAIQSTGNDCTRGRKGLVRCRALPLVQGAATGARSVESREDRQHLGAGIHPLLDRLLHAPQPAWEVELTAAMFPSLAPHHRVQGTPVFPGAGYVEACIAAALEIERRPSDAVVVEDLSFHAKHWF